ncbi:MAG: LacI family DNA-binding transcriptional regulator [Actinomycetota bacterium]|nr:LacI family DNA-binding transcriptional regulator [Actinomycetota bacterium]
MRAAADELGYSPDLNARSLRLQRTDRICLLVGRPGNPYADLLLEGLQCEASERGYATVSVPIGPDGDTRRPIELLRRGLADAAIVGFFPRVHPPAPRDLAELVERGTPVIVLSDEFKPEGFDVVRGDEASVFEHAVTSIIDSGRRHIAYLAHADDTHGKGSPRYRGYLAALKRQKITFDPALVILGAADDRVAAYRATCELLRRDETLDTIVSASDRGAISAIWALRDAGVAVPDTVAVMGFGDLPEGAVTRPALSTIGQRSDRIHEVAKLLFARLGGDLSPARTLTIPWQIHWRESAVPGRN